jgi:nucleotide-binding universal stress UspA family protein
MIPGVRYRRILIPLDGSETAESAIPVAEELAQRLGLPIGLVRVVDGADLPDLPQTERPDLVAEEIEAAGARAREYLSHVSAHLRERGVTVTTEVRRGRAARQILAVMQDDDLVVIAAGDYDALHTCLGSVAYTILGRARVPVLVVPSAEA